MNPIDAFLKLLSARVSRRYASRPLAIETLESRTPFAADFALPMDFLDVAGQVFFTADSDSHGRELWKTDGTEAGTVMVKDIRPGIGGSNPQQLISFQGELYFSADDGSNGFEFWKSDGTDAGTVMVKNIRPGWFGSYPSRFTILGSGLYFTADNGTNGTELWKSDGTSAGTLMVWDICEGRFSSFPSRLTNVSGTLYFNASDGINGFELWKSDGTAAGTTLVKDIRSGNKGSFPSELTNVDGTLYFSANDGTSGSELWKSDGTSVGTVMVKDILSESVGANPNLLADVNGTLYFRANDGLHGTELWKSDGSVDGTVMVADILHGSTGSILRDLINNSGTLYFRGNDGTSGWELWKSDGTESGTGMVLDIVAGSAGSNLGELVNNSGVVYFRADDGINGAELWKSDGTTDGTRMVKNIRTGRWGSYPRNIANINGTIYFCALDVIAGSELWKSDGTESGTVLVKGNAGAYSESYSVSENNKKTDGTTYIGSIPTYITYAGQSFAFRLDGADASSFSMDTYGNIFLANGVGLNFETRSSYQFNAIVTDSQDVAKTTTVTVTVDVADVNEAPVYSLYDSGSPAAPVTITNGSATITLDENIPSNATKNGLVVGTLAVSDVDADTTLNLQNDGKGSIVLDKTGAFSYNTGNGRISIIDASKVDFEKNSKINLYFAVTDTPISGDPKSKSLTTKLTVVVKLNDLNEAPIFSTPPTFSIAENNRAGAMVGVVRAADPDSKVTPRQTLSYSIESQKNSGNADVSIFSINPSTGMITVPTAGVLNFENCASYMLNVRVTDNGSPSLFTEQTVTVNVSDVNEVASFAIFDATNALLSPPYVLTITKSTVVNSLKVGRLTFTDVDAGSAGTYNMGKITTSIETATNQALTWDPATGDLTVKNKSKLTRSSTLRVTVIDESSNKLSSSVLVSINLV